MDWSALWAAAERLPDARVKTIVCDLQRDYARWCDKVNEFELATTASSAADPGEAAELLQEEVQALAVDIESYVAEINYLGLPLNVQDLFQENK